MYPGQHYRSWQQNWRLDGAGGVALPMMRRRRASMAPTPTGTGASSVLTERVTVSLVPQAVQELNHLKDTTGRTKTDLINRAISLLSAVEAKRAKGYELHAYDPETGRTFVMELLSA
jgi:hypothetical protein